MINQLQEDFQHRTRVKCVCVCVGGGGGVIGKQSKWHLHSNAAAAFLRTSPYFAFAISLKVIFSGCILEVSFDSQKVSKLLKCVHFEVLEFPFH